MLDAIKNIFITQVFAVSSSPLNPINGISTFGQLVNWVLNIFMIIGVGVVLIMLALGFVKYVTSQGEKDAVESAKNTLTYAVIGGVGLLLIFVLRSIILDLLDVQNQDELMIEE